MTVCRLAVSLRVRVRAIRVWGSESRGAVQTVLQSLCRAAERQRCESCVTRCEAESNDNTHKLPLRELEKFSAEE